MCAGIAEAPAEVTRARATSVAGAKRRKDERHKERHTEESQDEDRNMRAPRRQALQGAPDACDAPKLHPTITLDALLHTKQLSATTTE